MAPKYVRPPWIFRRIFNPLWTALGFATRLAVPVADRPLIIAAYRDRWDREAKRFFEAMPEPADHPVFSHRAGLTLGSL